MKHTQRFTLLAIVLLTTCSLRSQTMDGSQISGAHLEPYSNKWRMYATDKQGKERLITIWTDYAQLIELNSKIYMNRTQELYNPDMSIRELWTNLFERETLSPYKATQFKTNVGFTSTSFSPNQVNLSIETAAEGLKSTVFEMATPYWDWTMYGILLSGLPFEKGKSYTIPIFSQQSPTGKGSIIATIEGTEVVKDDNQVPHDTWKVNTNTGLTFWLSKEAPYVIQLTSTAQNGGTTTWRMFK